MAKGRMLNRVITSSKKVSLLTDPYAKLLYTWLIPFHDDYGNFHADPDLVKSNIFPREKSISEERIEELLAELVAVGLIIVYENGESRYLNVVDYEENQTFRSDRPRHADYPEYTDGMTLVYLRDTNGIPLTKQVKLIEVKLSKGKASAGADYTPDFESFWTCYPNDVGKTKAFKCWNTRLKEGVKPDALILAASNYAKVCERDGTEKRYIKHPATFLGPDRHFEDFATVPGKAAVSMTCSTCGRWADEHFCAARNSETEADERCGKWLPIMKGAR